jgi:hypothetical protein
MLLCAVKKWKRGFAGAKTIPNLRVVAAVNLAPDLSFFQTGRFSHRPVFIKGIAFCDDLLYNITGQTTYHKVKMNQLSVELLPQFLSLFSPNIQPIISELRVLIQTCVPDIREQVDIPSNIIAYGYGTRNADLICAIAPFTNHVNLMFTKGVLLPDPAGILEGTGKSARHVKISTDVEISKSAINALLQDALHLAAT